MRVFDGQGVTQFALQELTAGVAWQGLVKDPDIPWNLVLGHVDGGIGPNVGGRQRGAGGEDNSKPHFFTKAVIGNTKDASFSDAFHAENHRLHFCAVDVLTTA